MIKLVGNELTYSCELEINGTIHTMESTNLKELGSWIALMAATEPVQVRSFLCLTEEETYLHINQLGEDIVFD